MLKKMLMLGAAGAVAVGLFSSAASAALLVELKAVAGTGYTVSGDGKTVNMGAAAVPINFQILGSVGTNGATDNILLVQGAIVSSATGTGAVTGGGMNVAIGSSFQNNSFFKGTNQVLSSATPEVIADDGVGDVGPLGNGTTQAADLTGNTHTWAITGTGATTDFINLSQNASAPQHGNQLMGTMTLTPTGLGTGTGTTTVQWYYRSGTGNVSFQEGGAQPTRTFGTTVLGGAPVQIVLAPEPMSMSLLGLSAFGLLGARRRRI